MSSPIELSSFLEETFSQKYNFEDKIQPHGITLDELYKSTAFLESTPTNFIFSCPGQKNLKYSQQFDQFISFSKEYGQLKPVQDSIFPLFCHIIMELKNNDDESLESFFEKNISTVPETEREEAELFYRDEKYFKKLASIFSTQWYKIKCDDETLSLIVNFLRKPDHSQLFLLYSNSIIFIPDRIQQKDSVAYSKFPLQHSTSSLSILQAKIPAASFASISREEPAVFACIEDQNIIKIDTTSLTVKPLYSHSSVVTAFSLSHKSQVLLSGDLTGNMSLWSNSSFSKMELKFMQIFSSQFAPHGGVFGVGCGNGMIYLYDTPHHHLHRILTGYQSPVTEIAFHPNCAYLGALSLEPTLRIWDLRLADTVRLFITQQNSSAMAFSHDGKSIAVFDGELKYFDFGKQELIFKKPLLMDKIESLHFSMDSQYVYAVGQYGDILCQDLKDEKQPTQEIFNLNERVISSELLPYDNFRITTNGNGNTE